MFKFPLKFSNKYQSIVFNFLISSVIFEPKFRKKEHFYISIKFTTKQTRDMKPFSCIVERDDWKKFRTNQSGRMTQLRKSFKSFVYLFKHFILTRTCYISVSYPFYEEVYHMFINTDDRSKGVTASLLFPRHHHVAHQKTGNKRFWAEFSQIRKTHVRQIRFKSVSKISRLYVNILERRVSIICFPESAGCGHILHFYKGWLAHVANMHKRFEVQNETYHCNMWPILKTRCVWTADVWTSSTTWWTYWRCSNCDT